MNTEGKKATNGPTALHLRLLGDLIEYAIEKGWTHQQLVDAIASLALPMDDHARNVVAHIGLRHWLNPGGTSLQDRLDATEKALAWATENPDMLMNRQSTDEHAQIIRDALSRWAGA